MQKQFARASVIAAAVAAAVLSARSARAVDYVWDGDDAATNTNWSDANNWNANSGTPSTGGGTATGDTAAFSSDLTGAALNNTVDVNTSITRLLYRQTNPASVYTTSIDRNATLTLGGLPASGTSTATTTNSTWVVMPTTDYATFGAPTSANVVMQSTGAAGGTGGNLTITSANVAITGRPGTQQSNLYSSAVVDLRGLDKFAFNQPLPQGGTTNTVFAIGMGNSSNSDSGAYWGQLILGKDNTINSNRIYVGGQNNDLESTQRNLQGITPTSTLILGKANAINSLVSGNMYVGGDPSSNVKTGSGAVMFGTGPAGGWGVGVVPAANVGTAANNAGGLEVGVSVQSTSHHTFGVFDATSASGTMEGKLTGFWATPVIGRGSGSTGGGFGMLSIDNGDLTASVDWYLGRTRNAANLTPIVGVMNVGLKGADSDSGAGTVTVAGNLYVGNRAQATNAGTYAGSGVAFGVLNIANTATVNAGRMFIGNNVGGSGTGSVHGIVNLDGGTLITGQMQSGSDPLLQAGSTSTRLVNFNGGILKVRDATPQALRDAFMTLTATGTDVGHAYLYSGGGTIDTNGQDITIAQPLETPASDTSKGLSAINIKLDPSSVPLKGSGYRSAPIVLITGGSGVGATAVARINADGTLKDVIVTNPGTGYTDASPPTIQLIANAGTNEITKLAGGIAGNYDNTLIPFNGVAAEVQGVLTANVGGGFTKAGAGTLTLTGVNTYTGPTTATLGKLVLTKSLVTSTSINANGGSIALAGGGGKVIKTNAVAATGSGNIDLTDNKLIVAGAAAGDTIAGGVYGGVQGLVQAGYANGAWTGTGVVTSQSDAGAASHLTTLGTAAVGTVNSAATLDKAGQTFGGQVLSSGDMIVMYTYTGDANLDGKLDGDDYFRVDQGSAGGLSGWINGDFNYDGKVNGDDYFLLDSNVGRQGGQIPFATASGAGANAASGITAVPEPASLGLLVTAACGLTIRRRRNHG